MSDSIVSWSVSVSIFVFSFLGLLISIPSCRYVSLSVSKLRSLERGGCLSSAKLRSTDSVNPRAVLAQVRPRYRPLRDRLYWTGTGIGIRVSFRNHEETQLLEKEKDLKEHRASAPSLARNRRLE